MRLVPTEQAEDHARSVRIPPFETTVRPVTGRILDFDVETVAAGFADPDWVPQKITCVAWCWVGESHYAESRICTPAGLYSKPELRRGMLKVLLQQIAEADMLTGHNIARFDLPVINADAVRLGLEPVRRALVQDTMRLVRSKGLKKGQDNLGRMLKTEGEKLALDWQAWQDAYEEPGWQTIRRRAESDVEMHMELRQTLLDRNVLRPPFMWTAQ